MVLAFAGLSFILIIVIIILAVKLRSKLKPKSLKHLDSVAPGTDKILKSFNFDVRFPESAMNNPE